MTDNEIIKALECCIKDPNCEKCPAKDEDCFINRPQIALDIINRQKAEIERLKECPKCIYEYDGKTTEYCVQGPCSNFKTVEQIKSEAYKEFAKKLKKEFLTLEYQVNTTRKTLPIDFVKDQIKWLLQEVSIDIIDSLVEEYEKGR